jgi:hypothetical protein
MNGMPICHSIAQRYPVPVSCIVASFQEDFPLQYLVTTFSAKKSVFV